MTNTPVAVIMSVYMNDKAKYIQQSVESILGQTYRNIELYLQYDGPVQPEADAYLSSIKDERLHIYKRAENKGLAQSLNDLLAIVMPKGYEFIARMDADDISELNRLERQLQYYDAHPELECIGTWAVEITSNGEEYFRKHMPETHEGCLDLFHKRDCLIHPTVMFRRSYIEKVGIYALDTFYGEDTVMWAQGFAAGCKVGNVPEFLFRYRLDENFFDRRRGWRYAKGIWSLRHRVNKMLGFGIKGDLYALAYAVAKMMPTCILNVIYKTAR